MAKLYHLGNRLAGLKVPKNVQSHSRAKTGESVNLTRIGQLIVDIDCRGVLKKLAKPGARIGKTPAGSLDLKMIKSPVDGLHL